MRLAQEITKKKKKQTKRTFKGKKTGFGWFWPMTVFGRFVLFARSLPHWFVLEEVEAHGVRCSVF